MADGKAPMARMGAFEWILVAVLVLGVLGGGAYIIHLHG